MTNKLKDLSLWYNSDEYKRDICISYVILARIIEKKKPYMNELWKTLRDEDYGFYKYKPTIAKTLNKMIFRGLITKEVANVKENDRIRKTLIYKLTPKGKVWLNKWREFLLENGGRQ